MNNGERRTRELGRPGHPRRTRPRWGQLFKALVGFGAVIALMSGVLYGDIWVRQENLIEAAAAD